MPYVKLQPAHGQMTWQMLVRGFLARSFEAAIFVKPATLCWKAGLQGIRCTLDASTSDSVFQQQKKGCPRRSLTNKPVPVWQPCTVCKNTSYRKGKKKPVYWFHFLIKCDFIVVSYLLFGIFPSLSTFLECLHLFWNLEHIWNSRKSLPRV